MFYGYLKASFLQEVVSPSMFYGLYFGEEPIWHGEVVLIGNPSKASIFYLKNWTLAMLTGECYCERHCFHTEIAIMG